MLITKLHNPNCTVCPFDDAIIEVSGYTETPMRLCRSCALPLMRELFEDLYEVVTGDRHG